MIQIAEEIIDVFDADVAEQHRPTTGEPDGTGDGGTDEDGEKPSDPDTPTTPDGETGNHE